MTEKRKGLLIDSLIYVAAFAPGAVAFCLIEAPLAAVAAFTGIATAVIFVFSTLLSDVSVYDPYWSVAPPVLLLACMIKYRWWNLNAFLLLAGICLWAIRLTVNWYVVFKGLGHEDWRYASYREKLPAAAFHLVSFFGLHFVPTAVVYAGLTGALLAAESDVFSPFSLLGLAVSIGGVLLEIVSDVSIHRFLRENAGKRKTCNVSVWKYSRHPNYLGEILFWIGIYLYFAAARPEIFYAGLGVLAIPALFCFVSIPLMEKHNLQRRDDYAEYRKKTSMLLLLPVKKDRNARK